MSNKSNKRGKMNPNKTLLKPVMDEGFEIDEIVETGETDLKCNRYPKLYWPIYDYDPTRENVMIEKDMDYFPGIVEIKNSFYCAQNWLRQRDRKILRRDGDFWRCFFTSQEAYIVDRFFSIDEYESLFDLMCEQVTSSLNMISILCLNHFNEIKSRNRNRNGKKEDIQVIVNVFNMENVEGTFFEIHDRFVLLDDEIWHFGGTVGGVNLHLTAYSRGWIDRDRRFKGYLNEIITKRQ